LNVSPEKIVNIVTLDGLRSTDYITSGFGRTYSGVNIINLYKYTDCLFSSPGVPYDYEYARVLIKKMACISFVDMSDLNWKPNELKSLL